LDPILDPPLEVDLPPDSPPLLPHRPLLRPPPPDPPPRCNPVASFCLYLSNDYSSIRYNLSPPPPTPMSMSSSATLSHPVISSTNKTEESNKVSIEMTNFLYLGQAMRRYLSTILSSNSVFPSVAIWLVRLLRYKAKSSTDSPSLNASSSYSLRTFCRVTLHTWSSPMHMVLMQSHTSFIGL
jgi:hypothetical protein